MINELDELKNDNAVLRYNYHRLMIEYDKLNRAFIEMSEMLVVGLEAEKALQAQNDLLKRIATAK